MLTKCLAHWGLHSSPFAMSPDPDLLYPSKQHGECLLRLKYALHSNKGGALVVSNNAGDGKTTVLRRLIRDLNEELAGRIAIAVIDHPSLTPNQMVQEICSQLGVLNPSRERRRNLNQLKQRLQHFHAQGAKCVIAVDEGQMLKDRPDTLQELRILLNYSYDKEFLLTFILLGQKELEETIRAIPEFWQRLPVRYFLGSLDRSDTRGLICHRLACCGYQGEDCFTPEGYEAVYTHSKGIPRVICSIADLALLIGYSNRVHRVDEIIVEEACRDMEGEGQGFHYFRFDRASEEALEEEKKQAYGDED